MLDAEQNSERKGYKPETITPESLAKREREGLCQDISLEIFVNWYTFGGMNRGLSLSEIISMPSWLRKDFRYILNIISTRRREREHEQEVFETKPKKKAKK